MLSVRHCPCERSKPLSARPSVATLFPGPAGRVVPHQKAGQLAIGQATGGHAGLVAGLAAVAIFLLWRVRTLFRRGVSRIHVDVPSIA